MGDTEPTHAPSTSGLHPQLVAPSLVYLTGEDVVQLVSWNSLAGVKLKARLRILTPEGRVMLYPIDQTPNTDRTAKTTLSGPIEGWLIAASVEASSGTPSRGQTFAMLRIVRGAGAVTEENATLAADYVTSQQRLAYPGSGVRSSLDGLGFFRSVTGTDPAAGAEISETVPAGARWRLCSLEAALVTSAVVANRDVRVVLDDGTSEFFRQICNVNQPASNTIRYTASLSQDRTNGSGENVPQFALPIGLWLMAGWRVKTATLNFDAGDNWGAPQYVVEEFLEGA